MYLITDLIRDLKEIEKAMVKNIPINSTDEDQKDFYNFTIAVAINHCKEFTKQNKKKSSLINQPTQFKDALKKEIEKRGFDTSKIEIVTIG
jgi:hypothetical protein